jgi:hypothetical protein
MEVSLEGSIRRFLGDYPWQSTLMPVWACVAHGPSLNMAPISNLILVCCQSANHWKRLQDCINSSSTDMKTSLPECLYLCLFSDIKRRGFSVFHYLSQPSEEGDKRAILDVSQFVFLFSDGVEHFIVLFNRQPEDYGKTGRG